MEILYLPRFARQYKKLPEHIKDLAEKKEQIFRNDPFDPKLKTHKLHGSLKGFWAFSIDHSYRILFDFDPQQKNTIRFYTVGNHDIYD